MKKTLAAKLALAGTIGVAAALASGSADAAPCSACHTMHNSQNGSSMRFDGGATPLAILLRDDCIGCHSGINDATTVVTSPPRVIGTSAPSYDATGNTGNTLAGGDFWWVAQGNDTMGHNVAPVTGTDGNLTTAPGGTMTSQVQCAGTMGCHGNSAVALPLSSLQGSHHYQHNDITDTLGATAVGNSYRYLLGVTGREDTDWEYTYDNNDNHNRYAGEVRSAANATANTATISGLCARCHASFHNSVDTGSDTFGISTDNTNFTNGQWIRHPTDYDMSTTGEFSGYAYSVEAPVGRTVANLGSAGNVVTANHRIVLCVSCHRAHGSPYDDMLRWDYSTMLVGTGVTNGCMTCHTAK